MTLTLKTSKTTAVFEFEDDGMIASFTLATTDSPEDLVAKVERMLAFIKRETQPTPRTAGVVLPKPGFTPAIGVADAPPQFTGIPPVQPPSLEASLARAEANGWELIMEGDD